MTASPSFPPSPLAIVEDRKGPFGHFAHIAIEIISTNEITDLQLNDKKCKNGSQHTIHSTTQKIIH
jgi:hypothetical protein